MKTPVSIGVVVVGVLLLMTACPWGPGETYTVVYDGNGATSGTVPLAQAKNGGVDLILAGNYGNLQKTGYNYAGWNTQAGGTGTDYGQGASYTADASVTLYAKWTPNQYTVSFDRQGGTGGSTSVTATFGSPMPSAIAPTKSPFLFGGYYTGENGSGTQYYTAAMASERNWDIASNIELVAFWSGYVSPKIGTLRYVPGGTYQRDGTDTNITTVSSFFMSVHEITRAQFLDIMGTDPSDTARSTGMNDPVQRVSWYDAIAFCNKLSIAEGKTPVYTVSGVNWATLQYADIPTTSNADWNAATMTMAANGYRLPTEAEWMWAAMGATSGHGYPGSGVYTTGYLKAFAGSTGSNSIGDHAVYYLNSGPGDTNQEPRTTRPVDSKLPNELGLYDMSGNVWEWTWDWYGSSYPADVLLDPTGPASGTNRVIRGDD